MVGKSRSRLGRQALNQGGQLRCSTIIALATAIAVLSGSPTPADAGCCKFIKKIFKPLPYTPRPTPRPLHLCTSASSDSRQGFSTTNAVSRLVFETNIKKSSYKKIIKRVDRVGFPPPPPPPPASAFVGSPLRRGGRQLGGRPGALPADFNTEEYGVIAETGFVDVATAPLSTFSIDVDTAAYANVRRFLCDHGVLPPTDAVRIEELLNYFDYDYPHPEAGEPFGVVSEMADAPWAPSHQLVHIGLRSTPVATADLPPNNLVFLIDVSGSMSFRDKLPLLQEALALLVGQLRPQDQVAIVVYAGAAGTMLLPTSGAEKATVLDTLSRLEAGGSRPAEPASASPTIWRASVSSRPAPTASSLRPTATSTSGCRVTASSWS